LKLSLEVKYTICLIVFLTIPSLRAIFKYIPHPEFVSMGYIAVCAVFFTLIFKFNFTFEIIKKLLDWRPLSYVLISIFSICSFVIYPIADARKNIGKGSTGDDAIIEPALTLLRSDGLYSPILYDGAPISPGPGWILQNSPFALFDIYWLLSAFYIVFSVILFRSLFGKFRETNLVLILISTSLIFWELLVTGHDILAIGFSFVIFVSLIFKLSLYESDDHKFIFALAIAVGIFSTSRIIFICFPVLLSLFLWKFRKKQALIFLTISLFVSVALHSYFYMTSDYYQPLHLFSRGSHQVGIYLSIMGLILTLVAFIRVYKNLEKTIESWLFSAFICLSIPLVVISAGEFYSSDFNFSLWEGANYLVPPIPMLLFFIACKVSGKQSKQSKHRTASQADV